jgi:hypothetical protein
VVGCDHPFDQIIRWIQWFRQWLPSACTFGLVSSFLAHVPFLCAKVSYIPLSHSSDRYKVWQNVVSGGRVGFVQFGADNWEWRERDKETGAAGWTAMDAALSLFRQVAALRPTSMAMPPNLWSVLHQCYRARLVQLQRSAATAAAVGTWKSRFATAIAAPDAALSYAALESVLSMFGGGGNGNKRRIKTVATGGAPTPAADLDFAHRLCWYGDLSFVNSFGITEAGGVTSNGRHESDKYHDVGLCLVSREDLGYTTADRWVLGSQ